MSKQNALRDGVAPGGLYSKENIRIMLCYLLKSLDTEISKTAFVEILQDTELANYFEITDALSYLETSGTATVREVDGDLRYSITPVGRKVANELYTDIPRSARNKAYIAAVQVVNREKMAECTDIEIKRIGEDSCNLSMTIYDEKKNVMLGTTIYTADYMQADAISQRFLDDPAKLYEAVINALTD